MSQLEELFVTFGDNTHLLMAALGDASTLGKLRELAITTFSLHENFTLKYKYKEHIVTMATDDDVKKWYAIFSGGTKEFFVFTAPQGQGSSAGGVPFTSNLSNLYPPLDPISLEVRPTWAVASTITINNYHISQNDLVFPQLVEHVKERGCTLVQGSYRSGKSSHCEALQAYLNSQPNHFCLRIELSLIGMMPNKSTTNISEQIFNSVVEQLRQHLPPTYDMTTFTIQGALRKIKETRAPAKIFVLWDEFQLLVEAGAEEIRKEITEACRILVHSGAGEIYSCLGFGTFNLQFLDRGAVENLSSFHRKPAILMTQASHDSMKKTISSWLSDRGEKFADDVIEAWIQTCGGFLGIFSYIGYMLTPRSPEGLIYSEWTIEYARILRDMVRSQGTFSRVIQSVLRSSQACIEMIRINMLADTPIILEEKSPHYVDLMRMASAGVFKRMAVTDVQDQFTVSCPIIRHLVLHLFSGPSPLIPNTLFEPQNHAKLIERILTQLVSERHTLNNKLCWTEKQFPSEATFQSLIFADLKQAFAQDPTKANFVVLMETGQRIKAATSPNKKHKVANKQSTSSTPAPTGYAEGTKKRSDLLVLNGSRSIIELKADVLFTGVRTASNKSSTEKLHGAISQVVHYAKAQAINSGILLNMVAHDSQEGQLESHYEQEGVTVHVYQARFARDFTSWEWIPPIHSIKNYFAKK
eukprot:Phypoly_transcript_03758.p1 GENE.Phypoly_transcript_03758~~Phypoly_transcript_03758.p1  ORF type:complete len:697 (+),score=58.96 Phypoly_transcript_03758:245-2335(+)